MIFELIFLIVKDSWKIRSVLKRGLLWEALLQHKKSLIYGTVTCCFVLGFFWDSTDVQLDSIIKFCYLKWMQIILFPFFLGFSPPPLIPPPHFIFILQKFSPVWDGLILAMYTTDSCASCLMLFSICLNICGPLQLSCTGRSGRITTCEWWKVQLFKA